MHQQPYHNPRLPFTGTINDGLFEGKAVTIAGRVLPGAESFQVDFRRGTDIALHFNMKYGRSNHVVCNTMLGSKWGKEECKRSTPISLGHNFTLEFFVNRDSYSILVNGYHFMEYKHRISATWVDSMFVDGGVEIQSIAFKNPAETSPSKPTPPPYSPPQSYTVPYKAVIQGGMYPGKNFTIQGTPNQQANKFCIDLRFDSDIVLHFNPRFTENTVVRNSYMKNQWGPEERSGGMPFRPGQPFTVTFVCDTQCYRIIVNGVQTFIYNHRHLSHEQANIVQIHGDMSLSSVQL